VAPTLLQRLVHEAESQIELSAALAAATPRSSETAKLIAARQQQLYACLRHAEYAWAILQAMPTDIDLSAWRERIDSMKRRNIKLAQEHRYDEARQNAEKTKQRPRTLLPESGHAYPGSPIVLAPGLRGVKLQLTSERSTAERRSLSELVLLAAIFLLVVSFFRHGWWLLRAIAPEAVVALAAAGMLSFGISPLGVLLVFAMVLVRGLRIVMAWRQWAPAAPDGQERTSAPSPPAAPS
jgi:hypothetical protein